MALRSAHAGQELIDTKRLRDVIIGPEIEGLDLALLVAPARKDGDREDRPRPSRSIGGADRPAHGFHKAAANHEAKPGSRAPAVGGFDAIEFVEDSLEIGRRDPVSLIGDPKPN